MIIYETCCTTKINSQPNDEFLQKLKSIEKLCRINPSRDLENLHHNQTELARLINENPESKFFKLGGVVWDSKLYADLQSGGQASPYFTDIILHTEFDDKRIINPPIEIDRSEIPNFKYVHLKHNHLLIIDALMKQGSSPRYQADHLNHNVYSEHSGAIVVNNGSFSHFIVSGTTSRLDPTDKSILLPTNTEDMSNHLFFFHTHPNTDVYAGRIKENVIYEFPSANDVFNFIKYYNKGKLQASVIVVPEGTYVIRPMRLVGSYVVKPTLFHYLRKFLSKLEKTAIGRLTRLKVIETLNQPDNFHKWVSDNRHYINTYNRFLEPHNMFIEYYPRVKVGDEWCLKPIDLQYVA